MNTPITSETQLSHLLDYANELDQQKANYKGQPADFQFLPDGTLTGKPNQGDLFAASMAPVALTEHAMRQACAKLGKAYGLTSLPTDYMFALQTQAPEALAQNMNAAISRVNANGGWLVRTYESNCRAVLSNEYLVFDNKDMLGLLNAVLETDATPHRISTRSFVSVDNMNVDVLFKDINTGRGDGNGGFSLGVRIRNGEVGDWQGGVYPIAKRTSCDNSISVDDRTMSYTFKHFGNKTATTKRVMLKAAMGEILPFSTNIIEKLIEAEEKELPSFGSIVEGLGVKHGWSQDFTHSVFAGSEARYTLAGLVNGVTFAAHTNAASPEAMVEAEFLGGALLFDSGNLLREAEYIHNTRTAREAAKEARRTR